MPAHACASSRLGHGIGVRVPGARSRRPSPWACVGGTRSARRRSANRMICWNTGAAASPPKMLPSRLVEHDDGREAGVVGRGEPGERRVVLAGVVGRLAGGARSCPRPGSPGSAPSCRCRRRPPPASSMPVTASAVGRTTTWCGARQRLVVALAVGVDRRGDEARRAGQPVVGDRRVHVEHLCRPGRSSGSAWGAGRPRPEVSHPPSGLRQGLTQVAGCAGAATALQARGYSVSYREYHRRPRPAVLA